MAFKSDAIGTAFPALHRIVFITLTVKVPHCCSVSPLSHPHTCAHLCTHAYSAGFHVISLVIVSVCKHSWEAVVPEISYRSNQAGSDG